MAENDITVEVVKLDDIKLLWPQSIEFLKLSPRYISGEAELVFIRRALEASTSALIVVYVEDAFGAKIVDGAVVITITRIDTRSILSISLHGALPHSIALVPIMNEASIILGTTETALSEFGIVASKSEFWLPPYLNIKLLTEV
jgi:hypothetical protein